MIAANPFPLSHHTFYTLAFQTESAKELSMSAWQARWHQSPCQSQVYLAPHPRPQIGNQCQSSKAPLEAPGTPLLPSSVWSPDMPSSAHTPPDSVPQANQLPGMRGKPPDCRSRHQILPVLCKSQSCPPLPDSSWLISVNSLQHRRCQGPS